MKYPVRVARSALSLAALGFLLSACGGGSSDNSTPEAARPQDARTFSVLESSLPFAALSGAPETDRWTGVNEGAGYQIEVPKNWNGMLVMYAHGYAGTGPDLKVTTPSIRRHLIEQGYAWAASSYTKNYYDVRAGVEDTNALAQAFTQIAAKNGRKLSAPSKTYIIGHSMGGHITAAAVDEENIQAENHQVRYDGAVPMCGVLGDTDLFDFFTAYQTAAQKLAGVPATSWPVTDWATIQPTVASALFTTFPSFDPTKPGATTAQGDKLKEIVKNLTGGERPLFDTGFYGGYTSIVWGTFGGDGTINGILNDSVVSTQNTVFQLDNDPALSADEKTFNDTIFRVQPVPDANRPRTDGLRWVPKTNARISVPVVSLHTLGDMYVPFSMEQIYKRRADAQGTSKFLVQRAIRGIAHCDFTVAEQAKAFDDMVKWDQYGTKPAGDDVLTASTVANPAYGCQFTDNTTTADDSSTTVAIRNSLKVAAPCPAK